MIRPYLAKIIIKYSSSILVIINAETIEEAEKILTSQSICGNKKWQVNWIKPMEDICDGKPKIYLVHPTE